MYRDFIAGKNGFKKISKLNADKLLLVTASPCSSDAIAYKDKDVVTMLDMTIKGS